MPPIIFPTCSDQLDRARERIAAQEGTIRECHSQEVYRCEEVRWMPSPEYPGMVNGEMLGCPKVAGSNGIPEPELVPEPGVGAMLVVGCLLLALFFRKRF